MLLEIKHTIDFAKRAPFQKERLASACCKAGAAGFIGFDPTDGLDPPKTPLEKVFLNLSKRRLQNTQQINNEETVGFNLPWFNVVIWTLFTCVSTKSQQRMLNVLKQEALVLERERGARCAVVEIYGSAPPQGVGPERELPLPRASSNFQGARLITSTQNAPI